MARQTEDKAKRQVSQYLEQWSSQSGYFKNLATRLRKLDDDSVAPIRRLGITSCNRGEGTSTVAFQLAAALSQSFGISIALVDANSDHPTFGTQTDGEDAPGLLNALADEIEVSDCVCQSSIENLAIMPLGRPVWGKPNYSESRIAELFTSLSEHADLVIIDLPVVSPAIHWQALARQLDGVLIVVAAGQTEASTALLTKRQLDEAKVKLLGVVLNKCLSQSL